MSSGFLRVQDFVFSVDTSPDGSADKSMYTPLQQGTVSVTADMSPAVIRRRYVDGERTVCFSVRRKFTVKLLPCADDRAGIVLLSAALNGGSVRYAYEGAGLLLSGVLIPVSAKCTAESEEVTFTLEFENTEDNI